MGNHLSLNAGGGFYFGREIECLILIGLVEIVLGEAVGLYFHRS